MTIELDHTIVPSKDKHEAARFFARILGLDYGGQKGHFVPIKLNDRLTLDFDDVECFEQHHYAFHVDAAEFDAIFDRVTGEEIIYGSSPVSTEDMKIYTKPDRRGFYFHDLDGHILEIIAAPL